MNWEELVSRDLHHQPKQAEKSQHHGLKKKQRKAKQKLRSFQRHLGAEYRRREYEVVTAAHLFNKNLFFKPVNNLRKSAPTAKPLINFSVPAPTHIEVWADYCLGKERKSS